VFGVCGAAFLIRRDLFERLGGFDERFFMVYEDVDLSYRARLAGARAVYAPAAIVRHTGSATIGRSSPLAVYCGQRNLEWTWIQNTPRGRLLRSVVPHVAYSIAAGIVYARRGQGWPWLRGKAAALRGLPATLRRRRDIQASVTVAPAALWEAMESNWIALKTREKDFDFSKKPGLVGPGSS
jgi:GT2 family glycosyltransferase